MFYVFLVYVQVSRFLSYKEKPYLIAGSTIGRHVVILVRIVFLNGLMP